MIIAVENEDIVRFMQKHGILNSEVAERLGRSVEDFYLYLSEPLTNPEKAEIADIVLKLFDLQFLEWRARQVPCQTHRDEKKYSKVFNYHCCLKDGPKYTGQNRNYYEGKWGWD